ncbi:MAG: DUF2842 domain-containing protein [Alphaproteobacteria bacterium]|nr:MAG: DUF2842 domain-containing protein [Alphaproteobacteria bacterium]
MALSWKTRRRLSLVLLLVWLPIYVVVAVSLLGTIDRLPRGLELVVYVVLGIGWALPFRAVFRGVGRAAPDTGGRDKKDPGAPGS